MNYYENNERGSKRAGLIAGLLYVCLWAVLMFVVSFSFSRPEMQEGIVIDFGDSMSVSGTAARRVVAQNTTPKPQPQSRPQPKPQPNPVETQEHEQDAPEVPKPRPQSRPERKPKPDSVNRQPQPKPQPKPQPEQPKPQEKPREVNRDALFPGSGDEGSGTQQQTGEQGSNQGSAHGTPGGAPQGAATGGDGTGFSLAGRSVVGFLPQPIYGANKAGRVVVEITVDASGRVVSATYKPRGSTTTDNELVTAALKAARQSMFNKIEEDKLQTGSITYNFKLK